MSIPFGFDTPSSAATSGQPVPAVLRLTEDLPSKPQHLWRRCYAATPWIDEDEERQEGFWETLSAVQVRTMGDGGHQGTRFLKPTTIDKDKDKEKEKEKEPLFYFDFAEPPRRRPTEDTEQEQEHENENENDKEMKMEMEMELKTEKANENGEEQANETLRGWIKAEENEEEKESKQDIATTNPNANAAQQATGKEAEAEANREQEMGRKNQGKARRTRTKFTGAEDETLRELVERYGRNWALIASMMEGKNRKQLRERYVNFLIKNVSRAPFTPAEDAHLLHLIALKGKKFSLIAEEMEGRTAVMIKNHYYTKLRRAKPHPHL